MVIISKPLATVLATAIVIGSATIGAHAQTGSTQVLTPGRGVTLDAGAKKIAGYYLAGDQVCDLTLMFADRADADGHVSGAISRMNVPVKAGAKARIYTPDGLALDASCSLKANVMTLRPLDVTASISK